jgi:hypothetical protein
MRVVAVLRSVNFGERYVNPILRPRPLWFTVEVCKSVDARCGRSGEI